ncbi:MAG: hypothetical protein ACRCU5_03620 [Rhizobiaceae bacterium]
MDRDLKYAFAIHVAKYIGIGLVSGSIVHAGTLGGSSFKYIGLIVAGILMTLLGYVLEHRHEKKAIGARFLFLAVCLSFGTGMLSGGVQHYADNPAYGALLLSAGLIITFLALAYKDFEHVISMKVAVGALAVAGALFVALPFANAVLFPGAVGHVHTDDHAH